MCGIAGIITLDGGAVEHQRLKAMTDAIAHRGPDGEGYWINPEANVGLAHRRLSIIDLSEKGHQPMHFANQRYSITFNGEIYNYLELKDELVKSGELFFSDTDTEVILALYHRKREKCLHDLDGMFAFAIWDARNQTLFCARDRFGEKPFYYHYVPGRYFVFASEMKSLFAYGIEKVMKPSMIYNYLNNSFAITNPEKKEDTFYEGINKIKQSHYLELKPENNVNQIITKQYWTINEHVLDNSISFTDACEKFKHLFYQSISRRLRSDVPVGSSLSGGLDSSSIVCAIHNLNPESGFAQNSFSARFKNYEKDEGVYIEKVISRTGVKYNYIWPDAEGFFMNFDKLCFHQEEPFPTASIYAQYEVMRLAASKGVTVLLDGQGADEILAGYEYYFDTYLKEVFNTHRTRYQEDLKALSMMHPRLNFTNLNSNEAGNANNNVTDALNLKDLIHRAYRIVNPSKYRNLAAKTYSEIQREKLFTREFHSAFENDDIFKLNGNFDTLNSHLRHSLFVNNLEDLLRFSDRNSMAFSREVRLPFLSHELVEFVFSLPPDFKINSGWSKYLLRKSLNEILPDEIAWRKDKIGYEPPQNQWLNTEHAKDLIRDANKQLIQRGIVSKKAELNDSQKFAIMGIAAFLK